MSRFLLYLVFLLAILPLKAEKKPVEYVNPFIGTSNYGTTHPGAVLPNGLMSVVPFNVMGSEINTFDKDNSWWSTPYENKNKYFTGFSHVNMSGVGCPDLGSLLLMPTTGDLQVDFRQYGSEYTQETAKPGYYSHYLTKYGIQSEVTASLRTGISRFTFPAGNHHLLLNLGEGLTNESGAQVKYVSETEIVGSKLLGGFCYHPAAVFPVYFVMKINRKPDASGYWKKMPARGIENQWDADAGKYKIYTSYKKEMSGDDVGAWLSFESESPETIEVRLGVSFVSIENARQNLTTETSNLSFDELKNKAGEIWNNDLSRIKVEGGSDDDKTVFYTALYHTLMHPNILQDVNGEYPAMESNQILKSNENRFTVFSLWDTYRNVHPLLTLVYPERQSAMIRTMVEMYKESGWLPKWELFGRETYTMEGDPSIPVIVDSWLKGIRDFDVELAYEAMYKSATWTDGNLMRPDNDDYARQGYVPLREQFDNSVSHALEYYLADYSLSVFAEGLKKSSDAKLFKNRSLQYKKYFDPAFEMLRPKLPNGSFLTPFDPMQGADFQPSPGFHEGNAWNYTFYVPHDIPGLSKLMGGKEKFINKLQYVFDNKLFDPSNEPDIAYPYLFSYFPDHAWRTQKTVGDILRKHYRNAPDGLPGNDDAGTLSAWAVFSMMGLYPDCPGQAVYTITKPVFNKITIMLDSGFHPAQQLIIQNEVSGEYIQQIQLGDKKMKEFRIKHDDLLKAGHLLLK